MRSDRIQRQIERFLDEAESAAADSDWSRVRDRAQNALNLDPENHESKAYLEAAERALNRGTPGLPTSGTAPLLEGAATVAATPQPESFCDGRYQVIRFLGEG